MIVDLASSSREGPVAKPTAPFATMDVHADVAPVAAAWAELERAAPCSIYQTGRFLEPWARTLGRRAGMEPRFVLARDDRGRPVALLPLGLTRRGPLTTARLLGGRDANLQMALLHPRVAWTEAAVRALLRGAARRIGADLFVFTNQPRRFATKTNPLAALPQVASPSDAYGTALPATGDAPVVARLSADARKKLRKKAARLEALGAVTHRVAREPADVAATLDALLAQKNARFDAKGIASDFADPAMRAFLAEAAASEPPGIELHALHVGERIVATYGGAAHGGRWSGMVNSFDAADEAVARCSPGDLLLLRVAEDCRGRGLTHLDLGVGEARYKAMLCDEPIPLFEAAIGFGPLGRAAAAAELARQALKRRVKRSPRLFAAARRLARLRRP